jgi:hypothetical protein
MGGFIHFYVSRGCKRLGLIAPDLLNGEEDMQGLLEFSDDDHLSACILANVFPDGVRWQINDAQRVVASKR